MSKRCVLIVDGEAKARAALSALLSELAQSQGHELELYEASDGGQALELARKHRPDLVLMEVLIEGPHGLQVLRQLRKNKEPTEAPAVILVTNMASEIDRYWGLRSGAAAYVKKPWIPDQLRDRIAGQLSAEADPTPPRNTTPG